MVTCECSVATAGGVALVEAVLTADAPTPRAVTLAAAVEGPVWPPRRGGVAERDWTDGELTVRVPAEGRVAVGFATPAEPRDPPVEVVGDRRAPATASEPDEPWEDSDGRDSPVLAASVDGIVRALGDGRPPRDAVPEPTPVRGHPLESPRRRGRPDRGSKGGGDHHLDRRPPSPSGGADPPQAADVRAVVRRADGPVEPGPGAESASPAPVDPDACEGGP